MSKRNVTPLMHKFRNFFLQRDYVINHRYACEQSSRDVPTPTLPPGITHKLSSNYYYTRDGRRESKPAAIVSGQEVKALADGAKSTSETTPAPSRPGMAVPGMGISADTGKPNGPSPFH